jgi:hypothetical protein
MDTKKIYLPPRIKTLEIKAEDILNLTSVNDEVGDGNQLSKEINFDDFDDFDGGEESSEESVWE